MASRRAPLSNVPNAANSPVRPPPPGKRTRSNSNAGIENVNGPPPAKRQFVEFHDFAPRTPSRRTTARSSELRGAKKPEAHPTPVEKRLQGVRERQVADRAAKQDKALDDQSLERLLDWQRRNRKAFPNYVFYFEAVPEDVRRQCSRHLMSLGAKEERFFSRAITHIITTRSIPPGGQSVGTPTDQSFSSALIAPQESPQPRTINPSLLERTADHVAGVPRSRFTLETASGKRSLPAQLQDPEARKQPASRVDVLQKARDLGIKIWQLEKLQRVLHAMAANYADAELSQPGDGTGQPPVDHASRLANKQAKQPDLSQLIRNEKLNRASELDLKLGTNNVVPLKGPYIYIRCMNERTRPIMVREYPKVEKREDGEWPQFRSACAGKCPFIVEPAQGTRRYLEAQRAKMAQQGAGRVQGRAGAAAPRTRAAVAQEQARQIQMRPPPTAGRKRPLVEMEQGGDGASQPAHRRAPAGYGPACQRDTDPSKPLPSSARFQPGGEPMASGVQRSAVTSAIRSQVTSSAAAAAVPGARAGTSKDVQDLKRRVLENSLTTSRRMTDIAGTAQAMRNVPRAAKQKAQERLAHHRLTQIPEDVIATTEHDDDDDDEEDDDDDEEDDGDDDDDDEAASAVGAVGGAWKATTVGKEKRPGYCENCREKFDDFEDHVASKKHRKFASSREDWQDLDNLLALLVRPPKREHERPAANETS